MRPRRAAAPCAAAGLLVAAVIIGCWQLGKVLFDHLVHMLLIALERQHIVSAAVHNVLGNGGLAAHGNDGDDAALDVQQLEQLGDGIDLVALAVDLALAICKALRA